MDNLIIALGIRDKRALIVGGGERAARKIRLLQKTSADLTVVAPAANAEIQRSADEGRLTLHSRPFQPSDLDDCMLVISATGIEDIDAQVAAAATEKGVAINVPDRPNLSSFNMPALVDRNPVMIGISTDGKAPVLARRIRAQLENILPSNLGALARFAGQFRQAAGALLTSGTARHRFWESFFDAPLTEKIMSGDVTGARRDALALLNRGGADTEGIVHIVGAGPGDPDLLTVKAMRLLQQADVIVYDQLIGLGILDRARRDAERIYAGKRRANHGMGQDAINQLLVDRARRGERVVRLKGGDPFVFGRGGEELSFLSRHGVRVEVVPGITAAGGCAAAAGIPLTLRGTAAAVTFLTGQGRDGLPDFDWRSLAQGNHTLAVYMGLANAREIATRLIEAGLAPDTPVAVIENGTRPDQRILYATISGVAAMLQAERVFGPAIVLIGDVAQNPSQLRVPLLPQRNFAP